MVGPAQPEPRRLADAKGGNHIRPVADVLGHSSITVTGDIYGYTYAATARAALDGLDGLARVGA
jgi:integrase